MKMGGSAEGCCKPQGIALGQGRAPAVAACREEAVSAARKHPTMLHGRCSPAAPEGRSGARGDIHSPPCEGTPPAAREEPGAAPGPRDAAPAPAHVPQICHPPFPATSSFYFEQSQHQMPQQPRFLPVGSCAHVEGAEGSDPTPQLMHNHCHELGSAQQARITEPVAGCCCPGMKLCPAHGAGQLRSPPARGSHAGTQPREEHRDGARARGRTDPQPWGRGGRQSREPLAPASWDAMREATTGAGS